MNDIIGTPQMLKEVNSSTIEQLLIKQGAHTKPEIAKITGLSLPTVNKIVEDLMEKGRVVEAGLSGKEVGRKAVVYEINKDSGRVIALYYSWGNYICKLTDILGNVLEETTAPLDISSAEAALDSTTIAIDSIIKKAKSEVKCIAIGVPGVVLPDGRLCGIPKIKVWENFNLSEALKERYNTEIIIENDVKSSTIGFYLNYLSDKFNNIVYIYAGNGMGSGIIINKKLYTGSTNFSGELGFMAPLSGNDPECDYTSLGGYLEHTLRPYINYQIQESNEEYDENNPTILSNMLTGAAANYITIINPDAIIFGGEAINEQIIDKIRDTIPHYCSSHSIPEFIYDDNNQTGIDGLILKSISNLSTQIQLIQDGGI